MSWNHQLQLATCLQAAVFALTAYALGCLATGYYLVRLRLHQDIRELGSGNVGARNVGRVLGPAGFTATLAGDFLKGFLAVWIATRFGSSDFALVALLAVVAGHIWPAQLRFRGGKGVATSLGALLALEPHLLVAYGAGFAILYVLARKTVWPGLAALAILPVASWYLGRGPAEVTVLVLLTGLVLLAHRRNLAEEFVRWFDRKSETKMTRL